MQKGGGITTLRSKFFVSQYRKISLGNTSVYRKTSGIEKLCMREGGITFLRRVFLSHSAKKNSWGNNSMFQKISCIAKFFA